jgi:hypothetical protein
VDGGDGAFFGVDQEDGYAVGGLDGEEKPRVACGAGVAAAGIGGGVVEEVDYIGVELFQGNEREIRSAGGDLEAAAVFLDILAAIPVGEA